MRLADKIAIVTGAGTGIGRAIALGLAREGAQVVVNDVHGESCRETVSEIQKTYGRTSVAAVGDVSLKETALMICDLAVREFGRIDILVNNAGIMISGLVVDYREEDWDKIFAVNAKSVFLMCQAVGKVMIDQNYGKIVNLSSIGAKDGADYQAAYAATKAAVQNFSRALSKEMIPHNVHVNCVCPGIVQTEMGKVNLDTEEKRQFFTNKIPRGRLSVPEDMVGLTLFLASDESDYVVGQAINVDGGLLYI